MDIEARSLVPTRAFGVGAVDTNVITFPEMTLTADGEQPFDMSVFGDGGWLSLAGASGGVGDGSDTNLFRIVGVNVAER